MGKHEIIEDTGAPSEAEGSGAPASEPPASKTSKMALAGAEASVWVRRDFPGAMWHHTPRGDDIEIGQANAARAGWKELAGFYPGNIINLRLFDDNDFSCVYLYHSFTVRCSTSVARSVSIAASRARTSSFVGVMEAPRSS